MNIEKLYKKIKLFIKSANPFRRLKLIPKLALSYIIIVILCITIVAGFYYGRMKNNIEKEAASIRKGTLMQVKENIEYKVEMYNTLAEYIYLNKNLQDLLFNEYYEPFQRAEATGNIMSSVLPLSQAYRDIKKISLFVINPTIANNDESIRDIKNAEKKDWHFYLSEKDDSNRWIQYLFKDTPYEEWRVWDGQSIEEMLEVFNSDKRQEVQLALFKNLRHGFYGTYLGILKIDLNMDGIFRSLHIEDAEGWFDIIDGKGELFYDGLGKEGTENPKISNTIRQNYADFIGSHRDSITLDTQRGSYLLLKDVIHPTGWILVSVNSMGGYQTELSKLHYATGLLIVLCLGAFILMSWFMASRFSIRIQVLADTIKQIETGNFDINVPHEGYDEIDSLTNGINKMTKRLQTLMEEMYIIQVREKEAELKALQAQINPHFLYNTLASVSWLGIKGGVKEVTQISNALAKFYRISLSGGESIISIKDEIDHVKAYVEIQQIRFKDRIEIFYQVDPRVLEGKIPKLILQPFIENAIIHGMFPSKNNISIRLMLGLEGDSILCKIIDDGAGIRGNILNEIMDEETYESKGYGAKNIHQRLKVYFGNEYGMKIVSRRGIGTCVIITMPLKRD